MKAAVLLCLVAIIAVIEGSSYDDHHRRGGKGEIHIQHNIRIVGRRGKHGIHGKHGFHGNHGIHGKHVIHGNPGFHDKHGIHGKGFCPPRVCSTKYVPEHCRKINYYFHKGTRCRACDLDICRGSIRGIIGEVVDKLKHGHHRHG